MATSNLFESTAVQPSLAPGDATHIDWKGFLKRPILISSGDAAALRNTRILITGAGGSIGSALARRLMTEPLAGLLLLDKIIGKIAGGCMFVHVRMPRKTDVT